jgi:small nuclear ribonucleoprotein G
VVHDAKGRPCPSQPSRFERSMSKSGGPDLKKYLDKKLAFKLNGNRKVTGVLRGFDQFMNIVLDETIDDTTAERNDIGLVVRASCISPCPFRGPCCCSSPPRAAHGLSSSCDAIRAR